MRQITYIFTLLIVSIGALYTYVADNNHETNNEMVIVPFEDARFVSLAPGQPDSPEMALLLGNPEHAPSSMMLRMKTGEVPLHLHTYGYHLVVLEGKMKHWSEEENMAQAKILGPGSYWFQPGGEVHGDACLTDECLMFIKWEGLRDAILPEQVEDDDGS